MEILKGKGVYYEEDGRIAIFNIEMEIKDGMVTGRIFNEIVFKPRFKILAKIPFYKRLFSKVDQSPKIGSFVKVDDWPDSTIQGKIRLGMICFEKKYDSIPLHHNISYELERIENTLIGHYRVVGCPAIDFNCLHLLAENSVEIYLDEQDQQ